MMERSQSEQTGKEWEQERRWRPVLLKAVALAWHNEKFRTALLADAKDAFAKWSFGWEVPEHLDLEFVEQEGDAGWSWDEEACDGSWDKLPKSKLTITLPTAPPPEQQAIALADYNDAGRVYPFTCC